MGDGQDHRSVVLISGLEDVKQESGGTGRATVGEEDSRGWEGLACLSKGESFDRKGEVRNRYADVAGTEGKMRDNG